MYKEAADASKWWVISRLGRPWKAGLVHLQNLCANVRGGLGMRFKGL